MRNRKCIVYKAEGILGRILFSLTMYLTYLLGVVLFLIFGTGGESLTGKSYRKGNTLGIPAKIDKRPSTVLDSRQLIELEQTLNTVYKRFFGPPRAKLTLRSNSLANTILTVGEALLRYIETIMNKFGLHMPFKAAKYNLKLSDSKSLGFSVTYELMRLALAIRPIFQQLQGRINKYIEKNNYVKLGYKSTNFSLNIHYANSIKEWKNLAILSASKTYVTKLYNCLERNNTSTFDLKKALGQLTNFAPDVISKILHHRLERALPKNLEIQKSQYTELHAFVCHAISQDARNAYRNCIVEMKRVEDCANDKLEDSSSDNIHRDAVESSKDLIKIMKSLDASCVNVTGTLGFSVKCKENGRLLKNNGFAYVSDFLLGDLKKSPVLSRMARELVSIVKSSRIGAEASREIATVVAVLQRAMEKRTKLVKSARKDGAARYDEMSKNLANYKHHLARMSLKTMNSVNEVLWNVEKVLMDSTSTASRRVLSSNVRALKCFSDLMESMFDINWIYKSDNSANRIKSADRITSQLKIFVPNAPIAVWTDVGFQKKSQKESLKKWMDSMKHVGQYSSRSRSSAILTLANSFLLATMFYECMAVLATVMNCDTGSVSHSASAENFVGDNWRSQGKEPSPPSDREDRRSNESNSEKNTELQNNDNQESYEDTKVTPDSNVFGHAINAMMDFALSNQTETFQPKIVGGYMASIKEIPFLLALHLKNGGFQCGAVILSAIWGISALHCVKSGTSGKDYFVRAGSSINIAGGNRHRVVKFYAFNTQYFEGTPLPVHDIVLFRVKEPFRFSSRVKPAKLPHDATVPPKLLRISGWGVTDPSHTGVPSKHLQAANVTGLSWEDCIARSPSYQLIVTEKRHLCYGAESTDACYGDSGGPLADSHVLYGIVSFGDGCGVAPGVYTKVSYYRRWIKRITKI